MMSFSEAVKICLTKKYATISGRASRAEFWWFTLFTWGVMLLCSLMMEHGESLCYKGVHNEFLLPLQGILALLLLLLIVPSYCVGVRRFHDIGFSGWTFFFNLILMGILLVSLVFFFLLLFNLCTKGDEGANRYGPNPLSLADSNSCNSSSQTLTGTDFDKNKETTEISDVDL